MILLLAKQTFHSPCASWDVDLHVWPSLTLCSLPLELFFQWCDGQKIPLCLGAFIFIPVYYETYCNYGFCDIICFDHLLLSGQYGEGGSILSQY